MDIYAVITQENLDKVSRHCPRALSIYTSIAARSDAEGKCYISRKEVDCDLSISWTRFRNDVKSLACENLLEWHDWKDGIYITLANEDI